MHRRIEGWSQVQIQDFCQGRAPREWWPYMGWEWAIFDILKHRFATFKDVYCNIMPEWCLTTIQETPVSLLSALETREPAPSARVLPSQGWAPAPAPPPLDPRLGVGSQLEIKLISVRNFLMRNLINFKYILICWINCCWQLHILGDGHDLPFKNIQAISV